MSRAQMAAAAFDTKELGSYTRQAVADIALDVALLLQHHFSGTSSSGAQLATDRPTPQLGVIGAPAAKEALLERPEWAAMTECATLADALKQLAISGLAEQVRSSGYLVLAIEGGPLCISVLVRPAHQSDVLLLLDDLPPSSFTKLSPAPLCNDRAPAPALPCP